MQEGGDGEIGNVLHHIWGGDGQREVLSKDGEDSGRERAFESE